MKTNQQITQEAITELIKIKQSLYEDYIKLLEQKEWAVYG